MARTRMIWTPEKAEERAEKEKKKMSRCITRKVSPSTIPTNMMIENAAVVAVDHPPRADHHRSRLPSTMITPTPSQTAWIGAPIRPINARHTMINNVPRRKRKIDESERGRRRNNCAMGCASGSGGWTMGAEEEESIVIVVVAQVKFPGVPGEGEGTTMTTVTGMLAADMRMIIQIETTAAGMRWRNNTDRMATAGEETIMVIIMTAQEVAGTVETIEVGMIFRMHKMIIRMLRILVAILRTTNSRHALLRNIADRLGGQVAGDMIDSSHKMIHIMTTRMLIAGDIATIPLLSNTTYMKSYKISIRCNQDVSVTTYQLRKKHLCTKTKREFCLL
mmetsp:Transcript_18215/g.29631  ORF Transcript_18215/g.29631 Transcript_18215/m.29631 type:complete len:334 (-) Transcript_18215:3-1004(-)